MSPCDWATSWPRTPRLVAAHALQEPVETAQGDFLKSTVRRLWAAFESRDFGIPMPPCVELLTLATAVPLFLPPPMTLAPVLPLGHRLDSTSRSSRESEHHEKISSEVTSYRCP